jgi:hypothetical protein
VGTGVEGVPGPFSAQYSSATVPTTYMGLGEGSGQNWQPRVFRQTGTQAWLCHIRGGGAVPAENVIPGLWALIWQAEWNQASVSSRDSHPGLRLSTFRV